MPVLGFRVGNVAYCTDVSKSPTPRIPSSKTWTSWSSTPCKRKKHTTHFSLEEAVHEAQRIKAKQTWFTHIAHGLSHAATNKELPPNIQLSHDGLQVSSLATNKPTTNN
jgi:phosphoribosyl 1,2-cyclic phosphate phosphodiesterase